MKVSIITINYNSSAYTIKLIESILKNISNTILYEIIVTDNASERHDYEYLISNIPSDTRIKIFRSKINTGFSGGNMDGYNRSTGEYLLFINNDCECLNDVLEPLIKYIEDNDNVGLLTGKVRGLDGKYTGTHKLFPCLSRSLLGNEFARWISKNKFVSPKEKIVKPTKAQVVTGAFMFFKRSLFEEINGFDSRFFLDCEEEDISKRVWDHGKEVYVLPEPEIIHEHGGSKKENEIGLRNEFYISYKKLMFKHYSKPYSVAMLFLISFKIFRYFLLGRCKYDTLKLALKGFPEEHSLRYKQ
ncbi:MAG: glycosyltransferase family 2 protein [Pseudomonadota bacterium]|nr:glycosyltransferase family 2 protein [Pseudomonadota bacterium]